jgi:hypothetical protein
MIMTRTSKRRLVQWAAGMAGAMVLAQPAWADGWLRSRIRAICENPALPWSQPAMPQPMPQAMYPLEPLIPPPPKLKAKLGTPKIDGPPSQQTDAPAPQAPAEPRFEPLVSAALGDSAFAVGSPNMFGDRFGGGGSRSTIIVTRPGASFPGSATFTNATLQPFGPVTAPPSQGTLTYDSYSSGPTILRVDAFSLPISLAQLRLLQQFTINQGVALNTLPPALLSPQTVVVSPSTTATVLGVLTNASKTGGPLFQAVQSIQPGTASVTPSSALTGNVTNVGLAGPGPTSADLQYSTVFNTLVNQQIILNIPNPSSGGVVGRQSMSEDSNPLPRDRVIFNYDYFSNTALTPNGFDVHRMNIGFEKTFLDMRASIEVRLPFAGTLDTSSVAGTEARNTELGNVRITPRFLLVQGDVFNLGAGVGIHLPTASETNVQDIDGAALVRIRNQSVVLSPYIGALFTPNDRFFSQVWVSADFDTAGNSVEANLDGRGLASVGRLQDSTLLQADAQFGYWIFNARNQNRWLSAAAPFAEFHYSTPLNSPDLVQAGGFQIGDLNGGHNELNLSTGITTIVADRMNVSVGAVLPLLAGDNRSFDYQIGVRVNYFFGPTLARGRMATYVP